MEPCELAAVVTSIACSMFQSYDKDELAVIAAVFLMLSDTLGLMLAQYEFCNGEVGTDETVR